MKTCAHCGRANDDSAKFCQECAQQEFNAVPTPEPAPPVKTRQLRRSQSPREALLAQPWPEEWESWLAANLGQYPLLSAGERARLRNDARVLVAEKTWEGCEGLQVTPVMKITIAAQAALLLLGLKHDYFSRVGSIVVFPTDFELPAQPWEDKGRGVSGVAVDYGSVFLAWDRTLTEGRNPAGGNNVVIHEFAHQLDFLDGYSNGTPPLRDGALTRRWTEVMTNALHRLRRDERNARRTFLGSYATTNPAEFFSVISERFFTVPVQLQHYHSDIYEVLAEYYGVSPIRWFAGGAEVPAHKEKPLSPKPVRAKVKITKLQESSFTDFGCPYCGNTVSFPKTEVGKLRQCPTCLEGMVVPKPGASAERIPFPIQTPRLLLRQLQKPDWKELHELMSDENNLRYLSWETESEEEVENWLRHEKRIPFPEKDECIYFGIERLERAGLIGLAGLWFLTDELDLAEFLVLIHPCSRRQGYATEAVRGLFAYAFNGLHLRRIMARCDTRNLAGRRLLLKASLRQEGEFIKDEFIKGEWANTFVFALLREEFLLLNPPAPPP